jgi:phosphatidylinositol alpha-1,6-mannosyltransferase
MLLVGRMDAGEREKGHRELMAILPIVRKKVPDAELVFVGDGSDAHEIARIAAASTSSSHIFLPGRVDDTFLAELYRSAYAYVMPSRQEGFGLVHLEAMNYALPCVACMDDGAADVVVDGETGLLLRQPLDERELSEAIVGLLSNPDRARAMGVAGWRRLNAEFTAAAHQDRVAAALRPLLAA